MSGSYCVDANVFITAWYRTYPPRILKPLWNKIAEHNEDIILIKPVFDEIEPVSGQDIKLSRDRKKEIYPLRIWLEDSAFSIITIDEEVNQESIRLELEYEIYPESGGANQVDITLIAYAKMNNKTVVTLERIQPQTPLIKSKYKIPLICKELKVKCIDFIGLLDQLGINI
jgi:predicted nucleic acid-binding protein